MEIKIKGTIMICLPLGKGEFKGGLYKEELFLRFSMHATRRNIYHSVSG